MEASRLCPSNREIQRLLSRVQEECRQQQEGTTFSRDSSHLLVQDAVGVMEDSLPPPPPTLQSLDRHCCAGDLSPPSLTPTPLYQHLPSPTHSTSLPPPPFQHRVSPKSEGGGLMATQKSNPAQIQWLQSTTVQVSRNSQPTPSSQSNMLLASSSRSSFTQLPQELAQLGQGFCPSQQVQADPNSGASYELEDQDQDLISHLTSRMAAEWGPVNRFAPSRQFVRNQSKAAHYPMEVTETAAGPPAHEYQYHQHGVHRRPLSAHPASSGPPPRPLLHSQSINVRSSFPKGHVDPPSELGAVPGYHDDLLLLSSPQSDVCIAGGGTCPGEAVRSSRNTPLMGVRDQTVQVYMQYQSPTIPASSLSPSQSWAVSSVDTVLASPSKTPSAHPSSIAYHNRSNNNASNRHLVQDRRPDLNPAVPPDSLATLSGHSPSYREVRVSRTLPMRHGCSEQASDRRTGSSSPVKPKRPFVESNV